MSKAIWQAELRYANAEHNNPRPTKFRVVLDQTDPTRIGPTIIEECFPDTLGVDAWRRADTKGCGFYMATLIRHLTETYSPGVIQLPTVVERIENDRIYSYLSRQD